MGFFYQVTLLFDTNHVASIDYEVINSNLSSTFPSISYDMSDKTITCQASKIRIE